MTAGEEVLRARAKAHLPEKAFLRRDRGEALYVTNAPALGWDGEIPGFSVRREDKLAYLTPLPDAFEECGYAPDALAERLSRFRGASGETMGLYAACLKCVAAPDIGQWEACDRAVRQAAAVALRKGGGEGLYECALALAEAGRRLKKEITK